MGYDRRSVVVLATLVGTGLAAAAVWHRYIDFGDADWLLIGCWILIAALLAQHVDYARDIPVAIVAFAGGAFIETWGTHAGLWTYFTHQKPPLFILLAWPPATLATDRIARFLDVATSRLPVGRRAWRRGWLAVLGGFLALLAWWTIPGDRHPLTWITGVIVVLVTVTSTDHRLDLCRFVAGSLLGYLFERWGTSREAWTYWSGGTPPLVAVLAHGFASIAFLRCVDLATRRYRRAGRGARAGGGATAGGLTSTSLRV